MTIAEQRVLIGLIVVATLAVAARSWRMGPTDGFVPIAAYDKASGRWIPEAGKAPALLATATSTTRMLSEEAGRRLDINSASVAQLETIPGIGTTRAAAIVQHREQHGPFASIESLADVPGIGDKTIERMRPYLQAPEGPVPRPASPAPGVADERLTLSEPSSANAAKTDDRVDINQATAAELERLPGLGEVKSAAIVQFRQTHGPFQSVDDLEKVPGIGARTLESLRPLIRRSFTPAASPSMSDAIGPMSSTPVASPTTATENTLAAQGSSPAIPAEIDRPSAFNRSGRINVNTATQSELEELPGIGPALAARIIEHRRRHGPFRSAADLEKVSGIGEKRRAQIEPRVSFQ